MAEQERAFKRVGDSLLVSYTIDEEHQPEFTETYDIGTGGLAMLTNAQLALDRAVLLTLELRGDSRPPLRVTGSIRWSRYDELLGKFRTGVEFTNADDALRTDLLRYIDTLRHLRDLGFQ